MPPLFPACLLTWCVLWTIACGVMLIRQRTGTQKSSAFWGMTMLWIGIDLAIMVWAVIAPIEDVTEFRKVLLINGGLDVLYLVVGGILITRRGDIPRGFGVAILIQGAFLLILDFGWWIGLNDLG